MDDERTPEQDAGEEKPHEERVEDLAVDEDAAEEVKGGMKRVLFGAAGYTDTPKT